ncbi:hypothetical protein ACSVC9_05310 [Clostridium sp. LBM24168]
MINLFKAFAAEKDFFYDGAFIAKVLYENFQDSFEEQHETYRNEIIKNSRRLCVICCTGYFKGEAAEKLTVYLMMNVKAKKYENRGDFRQEGSFWHSFSKQDIADFSHTTGDTNSIHLTENPIVQGLLILKELCSISKVHKIEVKYIHPIYGDNPVYIKRSQSIIEGFSKGILCFKASFS